MPALIFFTESWLNSESASSLRDVMNTKTDKRVLKFGAEPHPCATELVPAMSWNGQRPWPAQGNEGQGQANANQIQSSFLPFTSVHGQQPHGFGGHCNAGWNVQNGGAGWDQLQAAKIPWQGWDPGSDPSKRQTVPNEINKMPAAAPASNPRGNGPSDFGRSNAPSASGSMTGEQVLSAALKLEEALMSNKITPEQALELSNQYLNVLAETVQRKPPPISVQQSSNDFEGSDSEGFSPKARII